MTTLMPPAPDITSVPTPDVAALAAPTPSSKDISACLNYRSLLDRFICLESLPEATYETVNEGSSQLPRFRSTVLVGEERFISPNVFLNKKKAMDDAAKIAFESLCKEIDEETFSLIHQGSTWCKGLLNEYADRIKLEKPVYNTRITVGHCILFASSLVFNGLTYVGRNAGTKKEAEILAAQAVLLDLIGGGDSMSRKILFIIIKSNGKQHSQLPNNHDFENAGRSSASMGNDNKPPKAVSQDVPTRDSAQEGIKPVSEAALEEMKPPSGGVSTSVKQSTSPNVALHKKEVEYDVVKTAVESLSKMLKEKPVPPSFEGVSFRSVLIEYANKRQLEKAVYNTVEAPGYLPLFVSSVVFNGLTYVGKTAKSRKEAEELAVEAVILALIGGDDSTARTIIYEIINAKMRHLATLHKNDSQNVESRTALRGNDSVPIIPTSKAEVEATLERNELPTASEPTIAGTFSVEAPSSKKRKRIRNKAAKQTEAVQEETKAPIAIVMTPAEHTPAVPPSESSKPKGEGTQETIGNPAAAVPPSISSSAVAGAVLAQLPTASAPTIAGTSSVEAPSSKKRKRIRNKAAKKLQTEAVQEETKAPIAIVMTPAEHTPAVPPSESSKPKGEGTQEMIENPAAVVPPSISSSAVAGAVLAHIPTASAPAIAGTSSVEGPSSKKRKRIRNKAAKKLQTEAVQEETKAPIAIVMTPAEHTPAVPPSESSKPKGEGTQDMIENPAAVVPPSISSSAVAGAVLAHLPMASAPAIAGTSSVEGPSSKKRKRIRNKAAKKLQATVQEETKAPIAIVMTPAEHTLAVPPSESSKPKEGTQETIENPAAVVPPSISSSAVAGAVLAAHLATASAPTIAGISSVEGPSSKKRKRIRNKAAKKLQTEAVQEETKAPIAIVMTPAEHTPAVPPNESSKPKGEGTQETIENPAAVVPPSISSSAVAGAVSMKRKRIRSLAAKKMRTEVVQEETKTPVAITMTSIEQTPAVPHHESSVPKAEGMQERIENSVAVVPLSVSLPSDESGPKKMQAEAIQEGTKTPSAIVPHHEFIVPKGEAMREGIENAVAFVPPSFGSSAYAE